MRGRFHQVGFIVSIPAGLALVAVAPTPIARLAAAVYAFSLITLYGTSSALHRLPWQPRWWRWMRRLDHSAIFVLIAGTYTPLSLLVLDGVWAVAILSAAWGGALIGITLAIARIDGLPAVHGSLYIGLGWTAVIAMPEIVRNLSATGLGLMLAGGVLYTAGAIVLATHRPDPNPAVFGYHEVWHSMVVGASVCHYVLVLLIVLGVA
jgi:hemolysin III